MPRPSEVGELRKELAEIRRELKATRREIIHERVSPKEVMDPTPVELPADYGGPPTMAELVQKYVRETLSMDAAQQGQGTFEEEDDFSEDDHDELDLSGYEVTEYDMQDIVDFEEERTAPEAPEGAEPAEDAPAAEPAPPGEADAQQPTPQ